MSEQDIPLSRPDISDLEVEMVSLTLRSGVSLERPIGALAYASPVLAFLGAAAVQAWALTRLRRRAARDRGEEA